MSAAHCTCLPAAIAERTVHVIGAPRLTELYAAALALQSHAARQLDGMAASLAGLTRVHQHLSRRLNPMQSEPSLG